MAIKKNMRKDSPKSKKSASVKKAAGTKKQPAYRRRRKNFHYERLKSMSFFVTTDICSMTSKNWPKV